MACRTLRAVVPSRIGITTPPLRWRRRPSPASYTSCLHTKLLSYIYCDWTSAPFVQFYNIMRTFFTLELFKACQQSIPKKKSQLQPAVKYHLPIRPKFVEPARHREPCHVEGAPKRGWTGAAVGHHRRGVGGRQQKGEDVRRRSRPGQRCVCRPCGPTEGEGGGACCLRR